MEETSPQEQPHGIEDEGFGEKPAQFKGIRKRKWGSWVSEIRMPRSRQKLWLGSYTTAQQAARAYDAAVYCLRGSNATFNFQDSIPSIPSASNLSRPEIQLAAESYATLNQYPSTSSGKNNNEDDNANNRNNAREGSASASRSDAVQDSVSLNNSQHQQEDELASVQDSVSLNNSQHQQEDELAFCESLFTGSDNWLAYNMERFPSIDESSALNLVPIRSPSPGLEGNHKHEEEGNQKNFQQLTALWKFGDV